MGGLLFCSCCTFCSGSFFFYFFYLLLMVQRVSFCSFLIAFLRLFLLVRFFASVYHGQEGRGRFFLAGWLFVGRRKRRVLNCTYEYPGEYIAVAVT
jgi:ABC-type multidrug transport system permease subunit